MDNFGYEIKQSISNFLTEMFPLSFLFHLSSTPRDRIRASPDPFSRVARVSPRKSPLSAVPVPPRWLKKQTLPRAQKKREKKISRYPQRMPPGKVPSSRPAVSRETSKPTKVPRPVRFLRRVSRRGRAFRASRSFMRNVFCFFFVQR